MPQLVVNKIKSIGREFLYDWERDGRRIA